MAIKIYIDQGHNPSSPNTGAEGNGYAEQDITYAVGQSLATLLRNNGNFEVRLSRPTPETQLGTSNASSLKARVDEREFYPDMPGQPRRSSYGTFYDFAPPQNPF